jgi:hypothetical protein
VRGKRPYHEKKEKIAEEEVSIPIKAWAISARETSHVADHRRTVQHG